MRRRLSRCVKDGPREMLMKRNAGEGRMYRSFIHRHRRVIVSTAFVLMLLGAALVSSATLSADSPSSDIEMSPISGSSDAPRRHFRLRLAARVSPQEAERVYNIVAPSMQAGYASSGHPVAKAYKSWRRFNRAPYLSASHGNHYLNNYANDIAGRYGTFEQAGRFPAGSVIAKDSFSIAETGEILLGLLYMMEKMPQGFNHVSGDWRYTAIRPDGTILGQSKGPGAERVEFCIGCHLAREEFDHLYFIPPTFRHPQK